MTTETYNTTEPARKPDRMSAEYQENVRRIVEREICYCVSGLVHILARGYGTIESYIEDASSNGRDLVQLTEQAFELSCPLPDYENAAIEAGWTYRPHCWSRPKTPDELEDDPNADHVACTTAEQACEVDDLDPLEREVYEHWAVSEWLADKLEARGEKVDRDLAGITVWARTTTGQAIYIDAVICDIYDELHAESGLSQ